VTQLGEQLLQQEKITFGFLFILHIIIEIVNVHLQRITHRFHGLAGGVLN
jgi:hypothetical protein